MFPCASTPALMSIRDVGEVYAQLISSQRMNCTRTGAPASFDISAAATLASLSVGVPNDPPVAGAVTWTLFTGIPIAAATTERVPYVPCVLAKIRAPSGVTSATQQFGPIGLCTCAGHAYVPLTTCAAEANERSTSP